MKASRTIIAIVVWTALVGSAGAIWVYRDYHKWLALGPGGLPYNFRGWMTTTWMRRLKRDPLDTSHFAVGGPGDRSFLDQLPSREGPRPMIDVHPVPHRQLDQLPAPEMKQKIVGVFNALVSRRSEIVHYQLSFFEKRNQAVFLNQPEAGSANAKQAHGEIAHIHPSDGSMHMIFSPSDAKKVIEAGWGECHPIRRATIRNSPRPRACWMQLLATLCSSNLFVLPVVPARGCRWFLREQDVKRIILSCECED